MPHARRLKVSPDDPTAPQNIITSVIVDGARNVY